MIPELAQVKLSEVAINLVRIAPRAVRRKIVIDDLGPANVRQAETDDSKRIRHAVPIAVFVISIEVIADRQPIIEHRNVPVQGLLVEFLLVQSPAHFIQSQFEV